MKPRCSLFVLTCVGLLLSCGCQVVPDAKPDPTRFFVLSNPPAPDFNSTNLGGITLGMHEIRLPVYLGDSRAMAVRSPGNRITYRDFERWAEPLDEGIKRLLRNALTISPSVARVMTLPFPTGVERDFDLQITVLLAEGYEAGSTQEVRFALDYSILTPTGELVTHGIYRDPARDWDGSAGDLARLLSLAVAAGADAIAKAIPDAN
jgi:uncharacterized lipoprotein YmbA